MSSNNPQKGSIAICGANTIGLITSERPQKVTYDDGQTAMAWTGIHLTDKKDDIGAPWSSKKPNVIGHISKLLRIYQNLNQIGCSFCGKTKQEDNVKLIAGPMVYICDECVILCYSIIDKE